MRRLGQYDARQLEVCFAATNASLGIAAGTIINDDVFVPPAAIVLVPATHPLALFALMLALVGFDWRRASRQN